MSLVGNVESFTALSPCESFGSHCVLCYLFTWLVDSVSELKLVHVEFMCVHLQLMVSYFSLLSRKLSWIWRDCHAVILHSKLTFKQVAYF
jgi:hypothetical protein